MIEELQRYIGRTVEIIYIDRRGIFTKRIVRLHEISEENVKVFCLERRAPRLLKIENIMAAIPLKRHAV